MHSATMSLSIRPSLLCNPRAHRSVALRIVPHRRNTCWRTLVTQARRGQQEVAVEQAPSQPAPEGRGGPLSNLPLVAVTVALVWGLGQTAGVWRSVTSKNKRDQETTSKTRILESLSDKRVADLFRRVDVDGNGRVDLRELTEALGKLNPNAPLSAARDSALDVFLLFDKDKNDRTLNREEFGQFLETWCMQTNTDLDEIASRVGEPREVEGDSPEDQRVEQEVTRAAETPEDLSRVLERCKLDAVFRLWSERRGEGGRVERKDLSKALNRLLDNAGGQGADRARALVTSPTGAAQHAGYEAHLNRTEFVDLVRRVSDVAGLKHSDVLDFLIMIPLYGEERKALPPGGTGETSRAEAMSDLGEARVNAVAVNRRTKAINILGEARKDAAKQVEAHRREEAERERQRQRREGNGKAVGGTNPANTWRPKTSAGATNPSNTWRPKPSGGGGGGPAFRGSAASEADIETHASDESKGSSSARS